MNAERESLPQDTNELLVRILSAVEPAKRKPGFELACAIVLALATTASAWCAYQSKLWGGVQLRAFDAAMFIAYMQARIERNKDMEAFLAQRFRPEMKPAVEAWLRLDPLNNPAAPPSPFRMAEYAQAETVEAARQAELATKAMAATGEARRNSDDYVLLTVVFASVLFFGGIARAFDSRRLRIVLAALAVLLFLGTVVALTTMPICHE
jgi:hypothetical protein